MFYVDTLVTVSLGITPLSTTAVVRDIAPVATVVADDYPDFRLKPISEGVGVV